MFCSQRWGKLPGMARRPRIAPGGICYHVMNRAVSGLTLFQDDADYTAFERVLAEARERVDMRICAYTIMPNHFHIVLWPRGDGDLSAFMRWLTMTHVQRWHAHRHDAGRGHVYQSRFKSFPIQRRLLPQGLPLRRAEPAAGRAGPAGRGLAVGLARLPPRAGTPGRPAERLACAATGRLAWPRESAGESP